MNLVVYSFLFSIFYCVGGSPRPVSYTAKRFSDQPIFLISFVRGMSLLGWILEFSFLFSIYYWVGGTQRQTGSSCVIAGTCMLLLRGVGEGMGAGHVMTNKLQLRHCRYLHFVALGGWGRDGGAHDDKHAPAASLPVLACCSFGGLGKGWRGTHNDKHALAAGGNVMTNGLQLRHCRYLHFVALGGWGRDGGAHDDKHAPAASLSVLACCSFGGLGKGWRGTHNDKHALAAGGECNDKRAPAASLPVLACCCFGGLGKGWGRGM